MYLQDPAVAKRCYYWYKEAAEKGNALAQHRLHATYTLASLTQNQLFHAPLRSSPNPNPDTTQVGLSSDSPPHVDRPVGLV